MSLSRVFVSVVVCLLPAAAFAQLPDGPGRAETEQHCQTCHGIDKAVSLRQDAAGWGATLQRMADFGAEIDNDDTIAIVHYLAKAYPAIEQDALNINKARAIQMESRLSLKRSEASAIIRYRREHGDFQSLEDLLKVPGIDTAKIEAKKDILTF